MRRTLLIAAAGIAALVVTHPASPPALAAAQAENRAAVVVDTGDGQLRRACLVFSEPSVTGLDVLRAAQMDPVVQTYSGQGGAVCKLCGVGCSAGSSCLTCQSPNYWQYWRGDEGDAYGYSRAGAGSTSVTNGDVEGWRWGSDQTPPPLYSVSDICSDPSVPTYRVTSSSSSTPTTTATAPPTTSGGTAPPTTSGGGGGASGGGGGGAGTATTVARSPSGVVPSATTLRSASPEDPTAAPVTTAVAIDGGASTTTLPDEPDPSADPTPDDGGAADELASARNGTPTGAEGSAAPGYAAFVGLLGALAGASVWARRRRRGHAT